MMSLCIVAGTMECGSVGVAVRTISFWVKMPLGERVILVGTGVCFLEILVVVLKAYGAQSSELKWTVEASLAGSTRIVNSVSVFASTIKEGKERMNSLSSANCEHPL